MVNSVAGDSSLREQKRSIKQRFMFFSIVLFIGILVAGSIAFIFSMRQIVHENKRSELAQIAEIERVRLEASVNGEIAIALKMANSPVIRRHFINPGDEELRRIAFEEIVGYQQAFASKSVFWISDADKEFYFEENNHYTLDPNLSDNYWYRMTLYETPVFNFNINYNAELQRIMLWINAPVFDSSRKPIGMVGTGIDLTQFVNTIYRNYSYSGNLYFFNNLGEITGASDASLIAKKVTLDKELSSTGKEVLDWAKLNTLDTIKNFTGSEGVIAAGYIPSLEWYVLVVQRVAIADYLQTAMTSVFIIMMGLILVIFIIFNVSIRAFLSPLSGMIKGLTQIAEDWDLMKRLDASHNDEIGVLAGFFNETFEKFRELLFGVKAMAYALNETGNELSANMDGTNSAVDKINTAIQQMRNQLLIQADAVNNTARTMERIISGLGNLNQHISDQVKSVAQSSSAIEEMLANIRSVTDTLVKNTANITTLAETSAAGRDDLQKVSTDIQDIAKESEGLLQINSVMQTIASQTNLLAMNAAIEAAHAGESGRGFAVVADEIRKLAENSAAQSKTISVVLKKIKASIDLITHSTSVVLDRFGNIEKEVDTVSNQESHIRNAMEEQGKGSRYILDAINLLNGATDLVKKESDEMNTESKEALKQSNNLKVTTSEVAGSMDEMTDSAEYIFSAILRTKEISVENKQSINDLGGELSKFKVE